jgi:hypothetical protein
MLKLIFNFACGIADQEKIKNKNRLFGRSGNAG